MKFFKFKTFLVSIFVAWCLHFGLRSVDYRKRNKEANDSRNKPEIARIRQPEIQGPDQLARPESPSVDIHRYIDPF